MSTYSQRGNELVELAEVDESEDYEVDYNGIYFDPKAASGKQFVLLQASGCSCWEGEYDEESFPSLEAIEKFLIADGDTRWHPTLAGAEKLIADATTAWQIKKPTASAANL